MKPKTLLLGSTLLLVVASISEAVVIWRLLNRIDEANHTAEQILTGHSQFVGWQPLSWGAAMYYFHNEEGRPYSIGIWPTRSERCPCAPRSVTLQIRKDERILVAPKGHLEETALAELNSTAINNSDRKEYEMKQPTDKELSILIQAIKDRYWIGKGEKAMEL
jgi:hypothetical protein